MRVPKTGSTTIINILQKYKEQIKIFDHNDGCRNIQKCNGTVVGGVTVASLRDPYIRFESQVAHLKQRNVNMFDILARTNCNGSSTCMVHSVNKLYRKSHRVIMWPQSMWIGPSTFVICVSENETKTISRYKRFLSSFDINVTVSNSRRNSGASHNRTNSHRRDVEKYYPMDLQLWNTLCTI